MKKKVSRDLIIFIILIPVFLWSAFQISSRLGGNLPKYSVLNKSKTGLSVFYDTLGSLKYPIGRSLKALTLENEAAVQIAAQGGDFDVNDEEVKAWVEGGGILIYLANEKYPNIKYLGTLDIKGSLMQYKFSRGMLIVAYAENLTNVKLTKDTKYAYELFQVIHDHKDRKIYFNEAHLYSASGSKSLWDAIPVELKYIIYQLLFVIAAYIYYRGKGFGKPVPLYEEVERGENEYLYSAAVLYKAAGAWDIMLDNYYKSFLNKINSSNEDWLEYWEREKLPSIDKAKEVYDFINGNKGRVKTKEYIHMVSLLERLSQIFEKRRETYWKILRKTL